MLIIIVTIKGMSKCMFTVVVTITARFICSANNYCYNNAGVYMQCYQLL